MSKNASQNPLRQDAKQDKIKYNAFPLGKINFILMGVFGLMIVVGFLLMLGAPSTETFNSDIFSSRRIAVGPTISFLGFILMAFAIMYQKKNKKNNDK